MKFKYCLSLILIINSGLFFAQERVKDTIDDQTVNVIKPYTPTISDAFKIRDEPNLKVATAIEKKEVKYNIFSIPVASTFTPAKGKAALVDKAKQIKLYDNYASLGFGSFTSILGEIYLNHELTNGENVGGYFSHHSSQGGIDGVLLDDDFSKTGLQINYSKKLRNFSWKIDLGANLKTYNWYGFNEDFYAPEVANTIDPKIKYNDFYVGGKLDFNNSFIQSGNVKFRRFGDDRDSEENRFLANLDFEIPIRDEIISTELSIDYLSGNFNQNYFFSDDINYGNVTIGLAPSYQLKQDDLTVDLGVRLVYFNDTELSENTIFIYPNIEASYRLVDDILIGYAGITGDLLQNSYYDFANTNPFVSPTLFIQPTDQQYHGFIGFKGKLSNTVSYNINGNYFAEDDKALFRTNTAVDVVLSENEDYQYGNSSSVVYDNVKTFKVSGELNIDVNRNFKLAIKGSYFNYNTYTQSEAWNLPTITGSIFLDYQISQQWYMGGSVFYVGERDDQVDFTLNTLPSTVTLDSFFDANAHVGYNITNFLSVYVKANNIANQNYERWLNFPVQGIQFLAGATYQFDF